jgi:structural maintenance of chromosome 2
LVAFDNDLKDLDAVIKKKKDDAAAVDIKIDKTNHEITALKKDMVQAQNFVSNLEKQYDWISEEQEYVSHFT